MTSTLELRSMDGLAEQATRISTTLHHLQQQQQQLEQELGPGTHDHDDQVAVAEAYIQHLAQTLGGLEQELSALEHEHLHVRRWADRVRGVEEVLFGFQQQTDTLVALCARYGYQTWQQQLLLTQQKRGAERLGEPQDQDLGLDQDSFARGGEEDVPSLQHETPLQDMHDAPWGTPSPATPTRSAAASAAELLLQESPAPPRLTAVRGGYAPYATPLPCTGSAGARKDTPASCHAAPSPLRTPSAATPAAGVASMWQAAARGAATTTPAPSTPLRTSTLAVQESPSLQDLGLSNLVLGIVGRRAPGTPASPDCGREEGEGGVQGMEISDSP